jgi:hypothetical protein
MEQRAAAIEQRDCQRRRRAGGRPWAPGTSGNPLGARALTERTAELFDAMATDFGQLSATDSVMLRQACRLLARGERTKEADAAIRMAGEARRIIESLRRRAPAKPALSFRDRLLAELGDDDDGDDSEEAAAEAAGESDDSAAITAPTAEKLTDESGDANGNASAGPPSERGDQVAIVEDADDDGGDEE